MRSSLSRDVCSTDTVIWNARGISEYCGKYLIDVNAQGKLMVKCCFF